MINMQYVCMCGLETNCFLFSFICPQSLLLWPPLKLYVQVFPPPSFPPYHRGLKTSINVGAVDCGFPFYEMKCDRIM